MIAPEYYTPQSAELKIVTPGEAAMHAIPGHEKLTDITVNSNTSSSVAEAFDITFSYNNTRHRTKVLKAGDNNYAFYKVVIGSRLTNDAGVYWLQHQPEGWTVLLGKTLDQDLIKAIAQVLEAR